MVAVTTVCTVNSNYPVGYMRQRKLFYAKGLHWLFYGDGTNILYRASEDGINWSNPNIIIYGAPKDVSVVYDGDTYVHFAYARAENIKYRRGKLNSDGTIDWDPWQDAGLPPSGYPAITLDSDGYPWIGVNHVDGDIMYPYVTKSSTKDGTWNTASGFPYRLSDTLTGAHAYAIPVALTNGKIYVLYGSHLEKVYGKLYNGSWGSEEVASTHTTYTSVVSASAYQDEVKVVFINLNINIFVLYYMERDSAGNWSPEKVLYTAGNYPIARVCVDKDNGDTYVFWAYDGAIYFQGKKVGVWDENYTSLVKGEGDFPGPPLIGGRGTATDIDAFIQKYKRYIGVAWARGGSAPYDLRYATLSIIPSVLKLTPNSGF